MPRPPKVLIYKDVEINEDGVTQVWIWECEAMSCLEQCADQGAAIFWENALKGAQHHIGWHRRNNALV